MINEIALINTAVFEGQLMTMYYGIGIGEVWCAALRW